MKKTAISILLLLLSATLFSQTLIKLKRQGGVSIIPCKINGLDLELIFDTGASDVSISLSEASSMLKNGKLTQGDIIGTANYVDANGGITEGIVINIKEIEIAGLKMTNIKASVVKNLKAPLLLGQTAISKLGKIQLDLNNNTLTILNGKGEYDYSEYSLVDKISSYYRDFTIVKIKKNDNDEQLSFSYTIPKKWKEKQITNPSIFKNYFSDEYPYGLSYELRIGLQSLPSLFNNYDSCQNFVDYINSLNQSIDPNFKSISTAQTSISFCKTIKNITLSKNDQVHRLNCQYYIFCGHKIINFMFSAYSSDIDKINMIKSEFIEFCGSKISEVIIDNAIENAINCPIESNATENKKNINITLKSACKWLKIGNQNSDLNLINTKSSATLSINILNENNNVPNLNNVTDSYLEKAKKIFSSQIKSPQTITDFQIVTINKKKYIHFKVKGISRTDKNLFLSDNYYYVKDKRFIFLSLTMKDEDELSLLNKYNQTHSDILELLNGIEFTSNYL